MIFVKTGFETLGRIMHYAASRSVAESNSTFHRGRSAMDDRKGVPMVSFDEVLIELSNAMGADGLVER